MFNPQVTQNEPALEFQGSFAPPEPSFLWKGFRIVIGLVAETPLSAVGFLILGIVLRVLLPPLAGCFLALSLGTILSKFFWKVVLLTRFEVFDTLERSAVRFQQEHPYIQLIAAIGALGLAILSTTASILVATALGIFNGIVAEANHRYMIIEKKRDEEKDLSHVNLTEILIT